MTTLELQLYEAGYDALDQKISELIVLGYIRYLFVPDNEMSRRIAAKYQMNKTLELNISANIMNSFNQQVTVITEEDTDLSQRLLLSCLNLNNGIVLSATTKNHFSDRYIYISCIPKSGTHLLIKMLSVMGIKQNEASMPVKGKWNVIHDYSYHTPCRKFINYQHINALQPMGQHPIFQSCILFMYRNPLDILVSELSWYSKEAEVFSHYLNSFSDQDIKLSALIDDTFVLGDIRQRMLDYIGWLDFGNTIPLSYEEVVGSKGGGSDEEQVKTIWSIQLKLQIPGSPNDIASKIYDTKSPTFSKGQIGRHKTVFKDTHYNKFLSLPQDFMEKMGYDISSRYSRHVDMFRCRPLKIITPSEDELWRQRLIKESYYGHNIVYAGGQYVVIEQSEGINDLSGRLYSDNSAVHLNFHSYEEALIFTAINEYMKKIKPRVPHLIEREYKLFNIIEYCNKYYALHYRLGDVDISNNDMGNYMNTGKCFIADSVAEVKNHIDIYDNTHKAKRVIMQILKTLNKLSLYITKTLTSK